MGGFEAGRRLGLVGVLKIDESAGRVEVFETGAAEEEEVECEWEETREEEVEREGAVGTGPALDLA